jgi:hypothetical protein
MSGGHYNYTYNTIEYTYEGEMENLLLERLLKDFCKLLRSLEWYKSGDTGREDYHKDVDDFIAKWIKSENAKYIKDTSEIIEKFENLISDIKLMHCSE